MKYSLKFKLEQIRLYKQGKELSYPNSCKRHTFRNKVIVWYKKFLLFGVDGLEHRTRPISLLERINLVKRVINGESLTSVATSANIEHSVLLKWHKIYLQEGINGLKSLKKGKKSMSKKEKEIKETIKNKSAKSKYTDEEIEYILAENAYLKKLSALVQGENQEQHKK